MKQNRIFFLLLLAGILFAIPQIAYAATEKGGLLSSDETWIKEEGPYIIISGFPTAQDTGFGVCCGATLTIEPGVVVKFEAGTQLIAGSGIIKAVGTEDEPIIFTALTDDTADGDTNGDAASTTPSVGYWNRISLGNDNDVFDHVEVRYGTRCFWLSAAAPLIKNSIVENCSTGVLANHSKFKGTVESSVIKNNGIGLEITTIVEPGFFKDNQIFNNNVIGVKLSGNSDSSPELTGNDIHDNPIGIYISLSSSATITGNDIYDNTNYGMFNALLFELGEPTPDIPAVNNWWGDVSGPLHETDNPDGQGDKVNDQIIFDPWLGKSILEEDEEEEEEETEEEESENEDEGEVLGESVSSGGGSSTPAPQTIPPRVLHFTASPERYKEGGEPVKLSWRTENAEFVRIEPVIGDVSLDETLWDVHLTEPTTFTLTALGPGGVVTQELFVDLAPRDPVIIIPGILGSWRDIDVRLALDPILHTYDGLWEGLKSVGYVENQTLFAFPYDWRNDNTVTARLFADKVNKVLEICLCQKVDVVAHSMGGLIARYYIQNIDNQHIDQLIFLGTPHLGAPKAYLAWEGGVLGLSPRERFFSRLFVFEALHKGYLSTVNFIRREVLSVHQLLPVYDYLINNESGEKYSYERCGEGLFLCNTFLEELNSKQPDKLDSVRLYNIVNDDLETFRYFKVEKFKTRLLGSSDKWIHGIPINFPRTDGVIFESGDETVPIHSARLTQSKEIKVNTTHSDLPYVGQSTVSEILTGNTIDSLRGPKPVNKLLFIGIKSPADISVTTPDGSEEDIYYSGPDDPEFIVIPEPVDGEYDIQVIGTGTGEYELEVALLGDDLEISKMFIGTITPGERHKFSLSHSAEAEELTELDQKDTKAPETELIIRGEHLGENAYAVGVGIGFEAIDESEIESTLYSLDSGRTWQEYEQDLIFNTIGNHEVLYRSIDEHGNAEYAHIVTVTVDEKAVVIEEIEENQGESGIIESDIDESNATSTPTTTSTTSGQVLGEQTENSSETSKNLVITAVITLISILILTYLIKRK